MTENVETQVVTILRTTFNFQVDRAWFHGEEASTDLGVKVE